MSSSYIDSSPRTCRVASKQQQQQQQLSIVGSKRVAPNTHQCGPKHAAARQTTHAQACIAIGSGQQQHDMHLVQCTAQGRCSQVNRQLNSLTHTLQAGNGPSELHPYTSSQPAGRDGTIPGQIAKPSPP
jgi:hypothetical protein